MRFKRSYYFRFEDHFEKCILGYKFWYYSHFAWPCSSFTPSTVVVQRDVHLVERTTRATFLVWTTHPWLAFPLCKI